MIKNSNQQVEIHSKVSHLIPTLVLEVNAIVKYSKMRFHVSIPNIYYNCFYHHMNLQVLIHCTFLILHQEVESLLRVVFFHFIDYSFIYKVDIKKSAYDFVISNHFIRFIKYKTGFFSLIYHLTYLNHLLIYSKKILLPLVYHLFRQTLNLFLT